MEHETNFKLSIVIPAFNEEKYLSGCLAAVIKARAGLTAKQQAALEIIVVNNASTDGTGVLAESFPSVKVVFEAKKGLLHARQAGYEASRGELVANIDADTLMPAGWIERVLEAFDRDIALVALSGPYSYHDLSAWTNFWVRVFYLPGYLLHLFLSRQGKGGLVQGGNYVIRRKTLEQMGGFDTTIAFYGEDTDVARRASRFGRVKFDFRLVMPTSGRRLQAEGVITMAAKYSLNFIWTNLTGRPFSRGYEDFRKE